MIPPGECTYAGRKRRKPVQKQRPTLGAEKSNPSKRHRDRLNAELDHLASLLPFPPDVISKLDKLSVLRLSVSYLRVKSFFQAVQEACAQPAGAPPPGDGPRGGSAVPEGRLLLESLNGFALVVSADGLIFYASATIVDYLGFHQTDVMHQNVYDYIHVDDRQDFRRQLHWAMDPPRGTGQPPHPDAGEDAILGRLLGAPDGGAGAPTEYSAFLTRCFICRVRCLLDSTSGFLTMQFQGKLKFLLGQKKKAPSGTSLPPRLSLFCTAVPVLLPSVAEMKMKSVFLRARHRAESVATADTRASAASGLCGDHALGKLGCTPGRGGGENGLSVFRAQTDTGHWARASARASCLCLRGGPDLVPDPEGLAGDRAEAEQERVAGGSAGGRRRRETHTYSRCSETPVPARHPSWRAERRHPAGGTKLKPQPRRSESFPVCTAPHGSGAPYPEAQGMLGAHSMATFRSPPLSHPPGPRPSAYCSQLSRPWRDVQGLGSPPTCHSLENRPPLPGAQCFPAGGYSEDAKSASLPAPPGGLCNPGLSLDVPIKMEDDSGSEDVADGCTSSQVWLGASGAAKRHLVTFPTRMHLKTELDCGHLAYAPRLAHSVPGAHPHGRAGAGAGPCRELGPPYPAHCACLEPEPPRHFCMPGHTAHQHPALSCDCGAPRAAPVVKREPLDSPPWAAAGQGAVLGMLPKSVSAALLPPRASDGAFLP